MKKGINEVNLLGRCGEIQFASSAKGLNYAKFYVAVSNSNGEKKTKTEWIPVSCRDSAPNTGIGTVAKKYLKKGMLVCVKGRFETTSKDGNTYVVVVVDADPATSLFFYETQSPQAQQQPQQAQQQGYQPAPQPQQQAPQVQQQGYQPAPQPQQQAPQVQQQPQQAQQQGYQPAPQPQQQAPQVQQQGYQPAPQPQQQAPQVQQQNGPLPPMPSFPNGNLISDDDIPF